MAKPSPIASKVAGIILPFVVFGLLGYSWYIYIFRVCVHLLIKETTNQKAEAIAFMTIASFFWFMAIVCYIRVISTSPGSPVNVNQIPLAIMQDERFVGQSLPCYYYSPSLFDNKTLTSRHMNNSENVNDKTPLLSISKRDGQRRYCHICECFKPDRSHHCRECNKCILKMDHHCPWVSGCVGFGNYKFFFLFTSYTGIYGLWVFVTTLPLVVKGIQDMNADLDPQWIVLIILAFVFGFTVLGFTGVHLTYILRNETTIEHLADRPYDIRVDFDTSGDNFEVITVEPEHYLWERSRKENWKSVMGNSIVGWFLPFKRGLGNGLVFPYSDRMYHEIVQRAQRQRNSMNLSHYERVSSSLESTAPITS
ncbi:Putative Palmitoyltransferase [Rhizopus microsporus]|nr:Putative Palmitoyltransferase [Rhizopus microsporus]